MLTGLFGRGNPIAPNKIALRAGNVVRKLSRHVVELTFSAVVVTLTREPLTRDSEAPTTSAPRGFVVGRENRLRSISPYPPLYLETRNQRKGTFGNDRLVCSWFALPSPPIVLCWQQPWES
jgi:hypothetical protein